MITKRELSLSRHTSQIWNDVGLVGPEGLTKNFSLVGKKTEGSGEGA